MRQGIRKNDLLFLGIVLLILLAVYFFFSNINREEGEVAQVTIDGEVYGRYSLKEDQVVNIEMGGKTVNILTIQDGKADMTEADCPDHLCVHQTAIDRDGETIVCLPNKVVVEIISDQTSGVDAIAG